MKISDAEPTRWTRRRVAALAFIAAGGLFLGGRAMGDTSATGVDAREAPAAGEGVVLENLSLPPGVSALSGITDQALDRSLELRVLVDGEPAAGRAVSFMIITAPDKAEGQSLSAAGAITDAEGRASVELTLGSKEGRYVVAAFLDHSLETAPLSFCAEAKGGTWIMFLVFGLLGGLGLFLMGMELSGEGLKSAAGDRMRGVLSALTSRRVLGLVIGVVATAVLQSSSATTVMLVGFVSATMMNLTQAIGVILGAKIGTTVTTQLIAFNLAEYSLLLVAFGVLLRIAGKRKGVKQAGEIILGFGLIFFGLGVMSSAMKPLRGVPEFSELLVGMGENPLLGILVAVAFTAIVQSSAATIGLAIALCAGGLLSLEAALPLAWGAHIGTCATALLSSLGTGREGKQVAVAHLILSILGVAVAYPFLGYLIDASRWLTAAMGSAAVARELANGHMLFTIVTGILLLLFVRPVRWLTLKTVPPLKTEPPFGPRYLSEAGLDIPVLALEQAHREIMRLTGIVRGMLVTSMAILKAPDGETVAAISREDDKVDILEKAIRPFLARVAQRGLEPRLSAREHAYIYIVQDLEGIGDIITKEIAPVGVKLTERKASFSPEGLAELEDYHGKLLAKLDRLIKAVETADRTLAEETLQLGFKERMLERRLRQAHLERLHCDRKDSVETSSWHLSVLNNLRAIGEKLDDIARTILEEL